MTIWRSGCEEKIINEMMTVSWRFNAVMALIIVAMVRKKKNKGFSSFLTYEITKKEPTKQSGQVKLSVIHIEGCSIEMLEITILRVECCAILAVEVFLLRL